MKPNFLATKSGEVTPYRRSVFEERIKKTQKEMKLKDYKKLNFFFETDQLRGCLALSFFIFIKTM